VPGKRAPSVLSRRRSALGSCADALSDVRILAIVRAARDAHLSECLLDALDCDSCRAYAARIAEAMVALQRDPFEEFDSHNDVFDLTFSDPIDQSR
jgi:hypothetical protein